MNNLFSRMGTALIVAVAFLTLGCQTYRAPGALLPSLAAAQQDRAIEKYAENSGFPTPEDVGLSANDEAE